LEYGGGGGLLALAFGYHFGSDYHFGSVYYLGFDYHFDFDELSKVSHKEK
jgi:hypothetical protein